MTQYSEHRNPMVIFADHGVQKCYNKFIERVSYFESQMDQNISSPETYRWYQKIAEEYDMILKAMRRNCDHTTTKAGIKRITLELINKLTNRISKLPV